jgi:HD-GYP domain-containing protein (c-di-GMP phosphodiesterase class II)
LSPAHLQLVKLHPQMACEILQAAEFPSPFWEIILQHHERLDGSGYPYGLTEGQIVPEAKILAVADVMDAMTSPRPHRPRLSIDAALHEILRGRGTVYDPCVVDACRDLFRRHVTAEHSASTVTHADGSRCKPEPAGR